MSYASYISTLKLKSTILSHGGFIIPFGWRKNTTNEPLAIRKLLLVVRAWIDEQNKINNLLSISHKAKLKLKP